MWNIIVRQVRKRSGPYADQARRQSPREFHLEGQRQLVDLEFASLKSGASTGEDGSKKKTRRCHKRLYICKRA